MIDQLQINQHKRWVAASFDQAAANYDAYARRYHRLSASRLVEVANLKKGQNILDIATGTGAAAIAAAEIVAPEGQVIGIDISKCMLEKAKENARSASLTNVKFEKADGEELNFFNEGEFDAIFCCSSLTYMEDYHAVLLEWKRIVKRGGVVAFTSYLYDTAFQPIAQMARERLSKYGIPLPFPDKLLDTPLKCSNLLFDTGFENIKVTTEQFGYHLADAYEWWDCAWHSPLGYQMKQLNPKKLRQFKDEHIKEVGSLTTSEGIWLDVPVIFALARKP